MPSPLCATCLLLLATSLPVTCVPSSGSGSVSESGELQPPDNDGAVRLVGGRDEREGRVEVFYGGQWGTVCGDLWGDFETQVVCQQLNFYHTGQMVLSVKKTSGFFSGVSTGPIHMSHVRCSGEELQLINCNFSIIHTCIHTQDVGVVCPGNCSYGEVRLVGGYDDKEGRVEICSGGLWGTVCDDHWDITEAKVVCRQLEMKCDSTHSRPLAIGGAYFGEGRDPILLHGVNCNGREQSLTQCNHNKKYDCDHLEDVGIFCCGGRENCVDHDIRLVGGDNEREGVVEVCYDGVWGTICDDRLYNYDYYHERLAVETQANVICKQLGFLEPNTSAVFIELNYGYEGPILLHSKEIECTGEELGLSDCAGYEIGTHSCFGPSGIEIKCPGNCTDGDVQLVGGRNSKEGRVDVCVEGHWVTMCHDRWTHREAEVVCRQLHYLTSASIVVALTGRSFGHYQNEDVYGFVAICDSDEARLGECQTDIEHCDSKESAGVICEVNCLDEETRELIQDSRNRLSEICPDTQPPSPQENQPGIILTAILVPLLFILVVLVIIMILLIILIQKWRTKTKHHGQVFQSYSNPLHHCDNSKVDFDSQTNTRSDVEDVQDLPLSKREASLPHLYESLKGQQLWLSSPNSGCLDVLKEERGAAANCNNPLNSIGNKHPYAILEAQELVRCNFADTLDSIPSMLEPSSLENIDEGPAVLNSKANALSLPPKLEPFSPPKSQNKKEKRPGRTEKHGKSLDAPSQEISTYDCLVEKPASSLQQDEWPEEVESHDSQLQSEANTTTAVLCKDDKDKEVATDLFSQYDRLNPEPKAEAQHEQETVDL